MAKLLETIDAIREASDLIVADKNWEAYRAVSRGEFLLSEVAMELHELDLKDGGAP
jgi:hypothetical protein